MLKKILFTLCVCSLIALTFIYKRSVHDPKKSFSDLQEKSASLQHLGIIMDGNRRWARKQGLQPWLGHKHGIEALKIALKFCIKKRIPYLTLYTFSQENFKRPAEELDYLFNTIAQEIKQTCYELLMKNNIQIRFLGRRELFPEHLKESIATIEEQTSRNTGLRVNIMFCYSGRQELVHAVKQIISKHLAPEDITEDIIADHLWTAHIPDPDLIIRTGYVHRLSNFLPYQSVYSELYFIDCYWPEITEEHLEDALQYYESIHRTFGA